MNHSLAICQACKTDLRDVLCLYAQPDLDNGEVLSLPEAELVFDRMMQYPNYRVYGAINDAAVVGTFALLIMDNLGHRQVHDSPCHSVGRRTWMLQSCAFVKPQA